ncbi:hypothetical protein C2845_PM07G01080 [Panicum miliaceum]|uniref:Uncharacterized protein n=1 Tax=Panicum miliaceum TaxID=4540 RepID=A0A3L6SQS7_PANMI|nr:hypothetical protein C2845_PM07G01080 [Panicum miliaceum]
MEEDWRDLAGTVPGTLMLVADGATGLLETVRTAHRKLAACARVLRVLETGGAIDADDLQEAPSARASLEDACRELVRLHELHGRASHAFDLYDALLAALGTPQRRDLPARLPRAPGSALRHLASPGEQERPPPGPIVPSPVRRLDRVGVGGPEPAAARHVGVGHGDVCDAPDARRC